MHGACRKAHEGLKLGSWEAFKQKSKSFQSLAFKLSGLPAFKHSKPCAFSLSPLTYQLSAGGLAPPSTQ